MSRAHRAKRVTAVWFAALILALPAIVSAASPFQINISPTTPGALPAKIYVPTVAGVSYRVEYETALSSGNWSVAGSVAGTGGGVWISDSSSTSAAQRLYRVVANSQPVVYAYNMVGYSRFNLVTGSNYVSSPVLLANTSISNLLAGAPNGTQVSCRTTGTSLWKTYFKAGRLGWLDADSGAGADGVSLDVAGGFAVYPAAPFTLLFIGELVAGDSCGWFSNLRAVQRHGTTQVDISYDLASDLQGLVVLQATPNLTEPCVWSSTQTLNNPGTQFRAGRNRGFAVQLQSSFFQSIQNGTIYFRFMAVQDSMGGLVYTCPFPCAWGNPPAVPPISDVLSTLNSSPTSAAADGIHSITVTATLRDSNGNPVPCRVVFKTGILCS
jgi:hypothetical protein